VSETANKREKIEGQCFVPLKISCR